MSLYFALKTGGNNKNKKSVKFQGDMLNFYAFIQVFVFTTNHYLKTALIFHVHRYRLFLHMQIDCLFEARRNIASVCSSNIPNSKKRFLVLFSEKKNPLYLFYITFINNFSVYSFYFLYVYTLTHIRM